MNRQQTTRQIQCVCGHVLQHSGALPLVICPECRRETPGTSGQTSFALPDTQVFDCIDAEADESDLSVGEGDRLGHFTVMDLIGTGGMGAVFRARDESLLRFVALKIIRSHHHAQALRDRLIFEARAQARVNHPNIVHIYYVGLHNDLPFFAMELVEGEPLSAIANTRRLKFEEVVGIAGQTVAALGHSARRGVIHGDVKPANIVMEHNRSVKLSDFGLAGNQDAEADVGLNNDVGGTLDYMAPEVAAGQPADELSDIFSLGVMLYQLTFEQLPQQSSAGSLQQQLEERQTPQLSFPDKWPQDRPEVWRGFLKRMLEVDRDKRFGSYEELENELTFWQPSKTRTAGRLQRACSFLIDQCIAAFFVGIAALIVQAVSDFELIYKGGPLLWLLLAVSAWMHVRYRKSPGKKLMQLRIVDMFGLQPSQWKLAVKSIGTYPFFWMSAIVGQAEQFSLLLRGVGLHETSVYETALVVSVLVVFVVNSGWLLLSKHGQSAADYFLNLKVVLDVPEEQQRAHLNSAF